MNDEIKILVIVLLGLTILYYLFPKLFNFSQDKQTSNETFGDVTAPLVSDTSTNNAPYTYDNYGNQSNGVDQNQDLKKPMKFNNASYGDNYFLDVGAVNLSLQEPLCSKSCCSPQWPLPFSLQTDKMVCDSKDDFIPSNITCNNGWQDTGCLCMSKEQAKFLSDRGGNA